MIIFEAGEPAKQDKSKNHRVEIEADEVAEAETSYQEGERQQGKRYQPNNGCWKRFRDICEAMVRVVE